MARRSSYADVFPVHVTVAERRATASAAAARRTKAGAELAPVALSGRTIASSFWGKAWCDNLERYRDFAHRLERGRSYLRSGAVIDLKVAQGRIDALVSGSVVYKVAVTVARVTPERWQALATACAGTVASLLELMRGELEAAVMERVVAPDTGLFPAPGEIGLSCSCPDSARMCKHVAAVLYGVGARLDASPELLFVLRHVDPTDLIAGASAAGAKKRRAERRLELDAELSELFGLDIALGPLPKVAVQTRAQTQAKAKSETKVTTTASAKAPAKRSRA